MKPSREEAEKAVKVLLAWAGDDPQREGLLETPARVTRAFEEYFCGYDQDPIAVLQKTFSRSNEVESDETIVLRNIQFESFCEHHLAPFVGQVHIAYIPGERIVGISKLARVVNIFSKRLQIQEKLTKQIAGAIERALAPMGCIVAAEAHHHCMTTRGAFKPNASLITSCATGVFKSDEKLRRDALSMLFSQRS